MVNYFNPHISLEPHRIPVYFKKILEVVEKDLVLISFDSFTAWLSIEPLP